MMAEQACDFIISSSVVPVADLPAKLRLAVATGACSVSVEVPADRLHELARVVEAGLVACEDGATCQSMLNEAWAERAEIDHLLVQTLSLSIEIDHRINVARAWALFAFASFAATLLLLFLPP